MAEINVDDFNKILSSSLNSNSDAGTYSQLTKFQGFRQNVFSEPALSGGNGFVFVTKPALFINPIKPVSTQGSDYTAYRNMEKDRLLSQFMISNDVNRVLSTNDSDRYICEALSYRSFPLAPSMFLPLFTNNTRSVPTLDTTIDTMEAYQTKEGYKTVFPTNMTLSEAAGTVTLNVAETDNLDFFKMTAIWLNYMNDITNGTFSANPDMIKNNMLDYACSIYYFMMKPDGRTLRYWCRYTSAFPTSYPTSVFSYARGQSDVISCDIPFSYTLKEELDPQILEDFNLLSMRKVTPIFTQTQYSSLVQQDGLGNVPADMYFDRQTLLADAGNVASRDPFVCFEPSAASTSSAASGETSGKFVLSFGSDSLFDSVRDGMSGSDANDYLLSILNK